MQYLLIGLLFFQLLFSDSIVTINKKSYSIGDFYKEYGEKEWENSTAQQKKELIDDFINRRLATLEATKIGLHNKPDITKKLYDRNHIALVNITYEELVAKPLVSEKILNKTRQNIVEERLLRHILIGHKHARTQSPPDRTIDEAFLLAQKISNELNEGGNFVDYAIKYSEDPTVFQNEGKLDWITWGRTIPAFQNEAFLLNKDVFSRPVLTDFGYHIIFCEDIRPSEYANLNNDELEEIVYAISRNTISSQLGLAATEYDSLQLINYNVQYNINALKQIIQEIEKQINKNKISGQYKLDLIDLFDKMTSVGVVVMFDNKGYGIKWFGERLKMIPSGRHPRIIDLASLKYACKIIVLQYLAIHEGYKKGIHNTSAYQKQKNDQYRSLLYDQYLKWLVNNAQIPDSVDIIKYYQKNKNEKYLEGNKASVREIKVLNKNLADSLFLELKHGANFIDIATHHSKTNPGLGGEIPPFTKGKYNQMGQIAFSLDIGEISPVITNLDRTYSIIRLDGVIDSEYIPLERVYNRIQSIITKDNQHISKERGLKKLHEKYTVIINTGFYSD